MKECLKMEKSDLPKEVTCKDSTENTLETQKSYQVSKVDFLRSGMNEELCI